MAHCINNSNNYRIKAIRIVLRVLRIFRNTITFNEVIQFEYDYSN